MLGGKYNTKNERRYSKNLLVVECERNAGQNDFVKMMTENQIAGLVNITVNTVNGTDELEYDITSKQPLGRIFDNKEIDCVWLQALIKSLDKTLKNAYGYMLDENNIVLAPEYIYANVESKEMEFVLFPFIKSDLLTQIRCLAEYILDRVDHTDSEAVMLAYSFYKEVKNDSFTIGMLSSIYEKNEKSNNKKFDGDIFRSEALFNSDLNVNPRKPVEYIKEPEKNIKEINIKENNNKNIINKKEIKKSPGRISFFDFMKKKKRDSENAPKEISTYSVNECKSIPEGRERDWGRQQYIQSAETEKEKYGRTILLSEVDDINESFMGNHSLTNINTGKTVTISSLPAVIGKVADLVDIVIDESPVSRMHARIFTENGEIFITDLASTNGTFVNGLIVNENENIPILKGDEIGFGNVTFIWE